MKCREEKKIPLAEALRGPALSPKTAPSRTRLRSASADALRDLGISPDAATVPRVSVKPGKNRAAGQRRRALGQAGGNSPPNGAPAVNARVANNSKKPPESLLLCGLERLRRSF